MNISSLFVRVVFAVGLFSASLHAVSLTDLQFNINIERNTTPGSETWLVFPSLETTDETDLYTVVASPNESFQGFLHHPMNYSSSSINYTSFEDIVTQMNGVWTITFGQDTPNPEVLTFTVNASDLTSDLFPAVSILSPTPDSNVSGDNFQATWTGPQNYTNISLYISGGSGYYHSYRGASATESDLITLDPGNKQLGIQYDLPGASDISISVPEYQQQVLLDDAMQNTYENWTSSSEYTVLSRVNFTVIPEPSVTAFTASAAILGLFIQRRRYRTSARKC